MAKEYTELGVVNEEDMDLEVEEKKGNKIVEFGKKHWKKALVGLGIGAAFIAGKCLGSKASDDDIYDLDDLVPDSSEADGPAATE